MTSTKESHLRFVSLEIGEANLFMRLMSMRTGINLSTLRSGQMSAQEQRLYDKEVEVVVNSGIKLLSLSNVDALDIRLLMLRLKRKGFQKIYLDYGGLLKPIRHKGNTASEIMETTAMLKSACLETKMRMVMMWQTGREADKRGGDKKPN